LEPREGDETLIGGRVVGSGGGLGAGSGGEDDTGCESLLSWSCQSICGDVRKRSDREIIPRQ
jgi:hypothetical protein